MTTATLPNPSKKIADFWTVYKGCRFTSTDVAIMMSLLKIGRLCTNPNYTDGYLDAIGYLSIGGEITE